ncbi:MAG: hypothetical protein IPK32_21185 [Verrucomicrobiaceae bacterium]|nr:hypothetical protein [Verrucomicrobiaceae bacterium]
MPEKPDPHPNPKSDASWLSFLTVAIAILLPSYFLGYNVVFTEGEVMQGLYYLVLILVLCTTLSAFYRRDVGIISVAIMGGLLLTWQTSQSRKWAMIHEDVTAIITAAMKQHKETGAYPKSINDLKFTNSFVRAHIHDFTSDSSGFRINYFINQPGITYSYSSIDGFWYYPD